MADHWTDAGDNAFAYTAKPSVTPKMPSFSQSTQATNGVFSKSTTPSTVGTSRAAPNLPKPPPSIAPKPRPSLPQQTVGGQGNGVANRAMRAAPNPPAASVPNQSPLGYAGNVASNAIGTGLNAVGNVLSHPATAVGLGVYNAVDSAAMLAKSPSWLPGANQLAGKAMQAVGPGVASKITGAGKALGGIGSRVGIGNTSAPFYGAYTLGDMAATAGSRALGWSTGESDHQDAMQRSYSGNVLENLNRPGRSIINYAEAAPDAMINGAKQLGRGYKLDNQIAGRQATRQDATNQAMASGTATTQQLADASITARRDLKSMNNSRWYRPWLWGL